MATYRIRKCSKGETVWFTAEVRVLFFFWRNAQHWACIAFSTVELAKAAIESHRRFTARIKKEVVSKL